MKSQIYEVVITRMRRGVEESARALFVSSKSSRSVVSAFDVHKLSVVMFRVEHGQVQTVPYVPGGLAVRPVVFVRWVGKVGDGYDPLRFEYRRSRSSWRRLA